MVTARAVVVAAARAGVAAAMAAGWAAASGAGRALEMAAAGEAAEAAARPRPCSDSPRGPYCSTVGTACPQRSWPPGRLGKRGVRGA